MKEPLSTLKKFAHHRIPRTIWRLKVLRGCPGGLNKSCLTSFYGPEIFKTMKLEPFAEPSAQSTGGYPMGYPKPLEVWFEKDWAKKYA